MSTATAAGPVSRAPLSPARAQHVAEFFPGLGVVVTGGHAPAGAAESVFRFDAAADVWSPLTTAPAALWDAVAVRLADGRWLALDALVGVIYDPASDVWLDVPALAGTYREETALSLLPDGDVLIVGGLDTPKTSLRYDVAAGTVASPRSLVGARSSPTATTLADGRVLAAGGWKWGYLVAWDAEIKEPLATAERYDPATDAWIAAAAMATPRERHAATLLTTGEVLVSGGGSIDITLVPDPFRVTATAERYDPVGDTWAAAATMSEPRFDHTATRLPSGRVLVAGGRGLGGVLASVEVYDPATDTWTPLPPMTTPRWLHTATFVPGHGVLIVGGTVGSITSPLAAVELYPFGQVASGAACVVADECASGACVAGVCEPGDAGPGEPFGCDAEPAGAWPDGIGVLGLFGCGLWGRRRRRATTASRR
ncbi:Kelch repeat-containing protein [Nannocystis bainbridge]|uniref:Kelch repeat-containing protein n=1 Tax=Nannocystis bainbridge TaxID=2995303 RepID=A0ABT5DPY1_9BACT|nr:kelch motif-containing protein [Nannocystis bainbridge]MDC0715724.1 kelch repeat-containing protein [Nannocystis bainbridge]